MTQEQAEAAIRLAKARPEFPALLEAAVIGWDPLGDDLSEVAGFLRDGLPHSILQGALACDADLERVLTHLRRSFLLHAGGSADLFDFACALAQQCANADYAYFVAEDEEESLRALERALDSGLRTPDVPSAATQRLLAVAAMYGPLHRFPQRECMLAWPPKQLSEAFRPLWEEQIVGHREEREIREQVPTLTPIRDSTSAEVRAQYEENPYPRWFTFIPPPPRPRQGSILVAGCGTGKHPVHTALAYPDCEVVAVDLSRASLAYAVRMARRFATRNLSFHQADILELGSLDRRFDLIEAIGVLHHLADPLAGWRALVGLLAPGGTMRVALYSELARRPLAATRDFIQTHGFETTAEGIRRCRRAILELPEGHPARSVMASDDFYSCSGFRDLVMHVQEHRFTLPQVERCLRDLGLRFQGFECPGDLETRFRAQFPEPEALADLVLWDRFERAHPDSFRGMYVFHCAQGP